MKKFIAIAGVAAVLVIPATASAMSNGTPPGTDNASYCGAGHGTFGYLGEQGMRHDLGQGDTTEAGSLKLGANGTATGLNNSSLCGNR
jgi:hypothetical protein